MEYLAYMFMIQCFSKRTLLTLNFNNSLAITNMRGQILVNIRWRCKYQLVKVLNFNFKT